MDQMSWYERFVKGGLKRGHFWLWRNDREICNNGNFIEVENFENPAGKVGFNIRSKKVELKWYWKTLKTPIKFHSETLEEWLMNRRENGKRKDRIVRYRLVGDYDEHQKNWHERFVKGGLKRGFLRIWWDNRQIRNNNNFIEVNDFEKSKGRVGFDIRSKKIKLRRYGNRLKNPIKFHKESLEEWLAKKIIYHGEKILEDLK